MDEIYPVPVVIRQAISHIDYCFKRSIMEVALEKVPRHPRRGIPRLDQQAKTRTLLGMGRLTRQRSDHVIMSCPSCANQMQTSNGEGEWT